MKEPANEKYIPPCKRRQKPDQDASGGNSVNGASRDGDERGSRDFSRRDREKREVNGRDREPDRDRESRDERDSGRKEVRDRDRDRDSSYKERDRESSHRDDRREIRERDRDRDGYKDRGRDSSHRDDRRRDIRDRDSRDNRDREHNERFGRDFPDFGRDRDRRDNYGRFGGGGGGGDFGRDRFDRKDRDSGRGGDYGRKNGFSREDDRRDRNQNDGGSTHTWFNRDGRYYHKENERDVFQETMATGINFQSYDDIPVELSGRKSGNITKIDMFADADVHSQLQDNVKRLGYNTPTPVQKYSISVILAERDLMACAQTGSGKTAAFLFPIVARMLQGPPPKSRTTPGHRRDGHPVALTLAPTRELAVQIFQETKKFCFGSGICSVVVYGGAEVGLQFREIERGCDVLVATPGRLVDLLGRGRVKLDCVEYLVFDEADRMLDMGFEPQIRHIVEKTDMPPHPQTVMFSATFPKEIQALAQDFLKDYIFLTVGRVGSTHSFITQSMQHVEEQNKTVQIKRLLNNQKNDGLVLIFVETKKKADEIESFLVTCNFPAISIHGDRSQDAREEALRLFKSGECPILVATDVAARGLDISNVMHVVNYDLPNNIDDYVHRIGRTGRAGNQGNATSFVNQTNRVILRDLVALLQENNQEVPSWFSSMASQCSSAHQGRSFQKGGKYKDFRAEQDRSLRRGGGGGGGPGPDRAVARSMQKDAW